MSTIEKVCSTCKHEPRDENCLGCTFDYKNADGNTHWESKEQFINKTCVSEQSCHDDKIKVLEKIKEEIETEKNAGCHTQYAGGLDFALSVIDRYMKKGEDKE